MMGQGQILWRTDFGSIQAELHTEMYEPGTSILVQIADKVEVIYPYLVDSYHDDEDLPDHWKRENGKTYYWTSDYRRLCDSEFGSLGESAIDLSQLKGWLPL